jgi:hypothetical protein
MNRIGSIVVLIVATAAYGKITPKPAERGIMDNVCIGTKQ